MNEPRYTEGQIRAAFYLEFHESGERWFPYTDMGATRAECEAVTSQAFKDFMDALRELTQNEKTA